MNNIILLAFNHSLIFRYFELSRYHIIQMTIFIFFFHLFNLFLSFFLIYFVFRVSVFTNPLLGGTKKNFNVRWIPIAKIDIITGICLSKFYSWSNSGSRKVFERKAGAGEGEERLLLPTLIVPEQRPRMEKVAVQYFFISLRPLLLQRIPAWRSMYRTCFTCRDLSRALSEDWFWRIMPGLILLPDWTSFLFRSRLLFPLNLINCKHETFEKG